eukprot:1675625-Pyramimonas_sp.AAC.1
MTSGARLANLGKKCEPQKVATHMNPWSKLQRGLHPSDKKRGVTVDVDTLCPIYALQARAVASPPVPRCEVEPGGQRSGGRLRARLGVEGGGRLHSAPSLAGPSEGEPGCQVEPGDQAQLEIRRLDDEEEDAALFLAASVGSAEPAASHVSE